jgi:hypothetical protein
MKIIVHLLRCRKTAFQDRKSMIETELLNGLRDWQANPNTELDSGRTLDQKIRNLLEFYICECIRFGPKELCGWWSDGVIHLEITEPLPNHFKLIGVTWIDSKGLAPFEFDITIDPDDGNHFSRTIFRIGKRDSQGRPSLCSRDLATSRILDERPKQARGWVMAVELEKPTKAEFQQG